MLSPVDDESGAVAATVAAATPAKTVTAFIQSSNFALMYTVPEGRKWVGRVGSQNQSSRYGPFITPAGSTPSSSRSNTTKSMKIITNSFDSMGASNSYGNYSSYEITLLAGDMIHSDSHTSTQYMQILGIESDA